MASSGKRKTTMAKLTRERRLRERRLDKQAKKDARKQASGAHPNPPADAASSDIGESVPQGAEQPNQEPAAQTLPDA